MPLILLFIQYSFIAQHVSAVNTTVFRSLRLTGCYFMGGIWFGVCWRSVSVWLWRCGVFMQSEATIKMMHGPINIRCICLYTYVILIIHVFGVRMYCVIKRKKAPFSGPQNQHSNYVTPSTALH